LGCFRRESETGTVTEVQHWAQERTLPGTAFIPHS